MTQFFIQGCGLTFSSREECLSHEMSCTPAIGMDMPAIGMDTPSIEMDTPSIEMDTPSIEMDTPAIGMDASQFLKTEIEILE